MGSNKHKHRSKKRKHYRSSDSSEKEYDKDKHRHHKKHHRERKEKRLKTTILVDDYDSSNSDDDVIIVPPPPPKISHEETKETNRSSESSLSIEETNKLRIKLGLKPLSSAEKPKNEKNEKKETFGGVDMGEFVHKPAENIARKTMAEKLKEKLTLRKERRELEQKFLNVKKLNEGNESDDDVSKWVEKNRKIISEKEQAEKRAKELDAMDEVFGIGELIEEDIRTTKRAAYTAKHLKGLTIEHSMDNFTEGREVVLTLKDKDVLDQESDTLVNVNMLDDELYKKNIDRRRQKPGYNAYDEDEFMDIESGLDKKILGKYDEEIDGEKKSSFTIGVDAKALEDAKRESIRNKLQQYATGKRLENLSVTMKPASEYFTEQEIECKFKKPKKKIRKLRKIKPLKADDLLASNFPVKREPTDDLQGIGTRRVKRPVSSPRIKTEAKEEPDYDYTLDIDDLPAPPPDTERIKFDINDEDDRRLQLAQLALQRSRKFQLAESLAQSEKMEAADGSEDPLDLGNGGSIVLNATAEFCRTLGDIPTYGQAGNREEDAQELLDFEKELKEKHFRKEDLSALTNNWNEVELDATPVDIITYEAPILDVEPDISSGVAGALKMAISKGYIQTEEEKRPSASRFAHLQAQNYSIEDKAYTLEDDKHARRERYCGPTSEFKEKEGYKPNIKLDYIDDDGHILNEKEAFRYLSHKFHGKGPGKNKIEKRMKKGEQEVLMKQMSSTDTPLGTLNMLQQKQKETQSPFVVLSGTKHGQSIAIAKLKR